MKTPNKIFNLRNIVIVAFTLTLSGVLLAQQESTPSTQSDNNATVATATATTSNPTRRLVVNGRNTTVTIRRIDGHSYVDLENLAQATNGSVAFEPTRVVLTIPGGPSGPAAEGTSQAANNQRLSRDFASAGNAAVSDIREWKGVLTAMVTYGMAINGTIAGQYHDRVQASVTEAGVAAKTAADHDALGLLNNQFANISNWAQSITADRSSFNGARTVDPSSLSSDQTLQHITDCDHFLNSMLVSGSFSDSPACH
jgi:hypothetical protein